MRMATSPRLGRDWWMPIPGYETIKQRMYTSISVVVCLSICTGDRTSSGGRLEVRKKVDNNERTYTALNSTPLPNQSAYQYNSIVVGPSVSSRRRDISETESGRGEVVREQDGLRRFPVRTAPRRVTGHISQSPERGLPPPQI